MLGDISRTESSVMSDKSKANPFSGNINFDNLPDMGKNSVLSENLRQKVKLIK